MSGGWFSPASPRSIGIQERSTMSLLGMVSFEMSTNSKKQSESRVDKMLMASSVLPYYQATS